MTDGPNGPPGVFMVSSRSLPASKHVRMRGSVWVVSFLQLLSSCSKLAWVSGGVSWAQNAKAYWSSTSAVGVYFDLSELSIPFRTIAA